MKNYFTAIGMSTFALLSGGCSKAHPQTTPAAVAPEQQPELLTSILVIPELPSDIPGGAPDATLTQAAFFAWQEFISLNWPAVPQTGAPGTRDQPDATQKFGAPGYSGPLTWHTYRGKVEIFPGKGVPPGGKAKVVNGITVLTTLPNGAGYGYDFAPTYVYDAAISPSSGAPSPTTPWINLDENSEIGLDKIYAGVASSNPEPLANQILFAAKANRAEFDYLAPKGWWQSNVVPFADTQQYLAANQSDPPAGSDTLVSLPNGTVELKSAWRKLAASEDASRFYTTTARYYVEGPNGERQYVDDTFALIALHIIQKTPTAPYFTFATFEQADAITDAAGKPVEDADGRFIGSPALASPLTPNIVSTNATPTTQQTFTPAHSDVSDPKQQLYYENVASEGLTTGKILVNRRQHPIPAEVIAVNATAHQAIADYMQQNFPAGTTSPWEYYKLVNVQSKPISGKVPGVNYAGADAATYYQANSAVETDYNLQVFSGRFSGKGNTITDYTDATSTSPGVPFNNVVYDHSSYNMGGCMGCHGNAQHAGADFSFILLGGRVASPDAAGPTSTQSLAKFQALFQR